MTPVAYGLPVGSDEIARGKRGTAIAVMVAAGLRDRTARQRGHRHETHHQTLHCHAFGLVSNPQRSTRVCVSFSE
jgi:hypothetical protein